MKLQEKIKQDLQEAIKNRTYTNHLKLIVGELQRFPKKELDDNEVIIVLRKLIKSEKENLERINNTTSDYLQTVEQYLPIQVSSDCIEQWIRKNVDFSTLKVKFQAIKQVVDHFGSRVNGKIVKDILIEKF